MRVKATAKGYLGQLREPGDEFDVPEGAKGSWFAPVKAEEEPVRRGRPPKANDDPAE